MNLFRRKEKPQAEVVEFVKGQIRPGIDTTFNFGYLPLSVNLGTYRLLREAIPMLDVVPSIYSRLIGDFKLHADSESDQALLDDFKFNVLVNYIQRGFHSCLWQARDSAIALGFGVFELVPQRSYTDVNRLQNAKSDHFRFINKNGNLVFGAFTETSFQPVEIKEQNYVKYLSYDMRDGDPNGVSIFYSLPFVGQIVATIEQSIKNTIERIGNPPFLIWVKGGEKTSEGTVAQIASKLEDAIYNVFYYKREGKSRDVSAGVPNGGEIHVDVIGGNQAMMELEWPVHIVLEQIIAKLEIPPFYFGLYKWDNRQTMSGDQRDMLCAKIEMMRMIEQPIIEDIVKLKMALVGRASAKWEFEWDEMPLKDEETAARSRLLDATAKEKIVNYVEKMMLSGLMDVPEAMEYLNDNGIETGPAKNVERLTQKQQLMFIKSLAEDIRK